MNFRKLVRYLRQESEKAVEVIQNLNRCHICNHVALGDDSALCLTCSERADRGEVYYDPDRGWREKRGP